MVTNRFSATHNWPGLESWGFFWLSHDNYLSQNYANLTEILQMLDLVFLDILYRFWHDIVDRFWIFLAKLAFANKQALFTHTGIVFFFKAFVTQNHDIQHFMASLVYFYPPIGTKPIWSRSNFCPIIGLNWSFFENLENSKFMLES